MRMQLFLQKLITRALINEDRRPACRIFHLSHKLGRIIGTPLCLVGAEISCECFLAPRTASRRGDRCKSGQRAVALRILERYDERTVAAHRMAKNADARRIDCE